jgi:dolichyl-phosphate-mannose--protein O-mannosyl transferase
MLLPRFSIRWILLFTTVVCILFVVVRQAFLMQVWAIAVSAMLGFAVAVFLAFGAMFLAAYSLARTTRSLKPPEAPSNPFIVDGQYPPQMIPKNTFGGEKQ